MGPPDPPLVIDSINAKSKDIAVSSKGILCGGLSRVFLEDPYETKKIAVRHESWLDYVETGKQWDFVISFLKTQEEATSSNLHWVQKGTLWKIIRLLDTAGVQAVPS